MAHANKQKIIYMRSTNRKDKRALKTMTGIPVIRRQVYFDLYLN